MNDYIVIELTLFNNFIDFEDVINLSNTNKYFNKFCKKYIKMYCKRLKQTRDIINKINIIGYSYYYYPYSEKYWYSLFNTNFDSYQLSLYYSYFILDYYKRKSYFKSENYIKDKTFNNDTFNNDTFNNDTFNNDKFNNDKNYKKYYYEYNTWTCIAYPNGYIKQIIDCNNYIDNIDSMSNNYSSEIIITFTLYFKIFIYELNSATECVNKFHDIDINYKYNYKTNEKIYINKKLLKYNLMKG